MKVIDYIAAILLLIGGLNWGLVGFFSFNLIGALFGGSVITMIIFDLAGLAALWAIIRWIQKECCTSC